MLMLRASSIAARRLALQAYQGGGAARSFRGGVRGAAFPPAPPQAAPGAASRRLGFPASVPAAGAGGGTGSEGVRSYFKRVGEYARSTLFKGKMVAPDVIGGLSEVPPVPLLLGLAGAIPFIALASPLSSVVPLPPFLRDDAAGWQAAYGAVILSFLGGVHWGLAIAGQGGAAATASVTAMRYVWSVTPSLLAWPALLCPEPLNFAVLIASFGGAYAVDARYASLGLLGPPWFITLRKVLTLLATTSMGCTLLVKAIPGQSRARH